MLYVLEPLDSLPEIIIRKTPEALRSQSNHYSEVIGSGPPLHISPLSKDENTIALFRTCHVDGSEWRPDKWWANQGTLFRASNKLLQPHGKGKLFMKGISCRTFHGTWKWKNGNLVTPLTDPLSDDDPEPVTEDENSNSAEEPRRGNTISQATNTKYALNKNIILRKQGRSLPLTRGSQEAFSQVPAYW